MNRYIRNILIIAIVVIGTIAILGCGNTKEEISIRGYITSINKYEDTITILVEGNIEEDTIYDKASIRVEKKTKIYTGDKKGNMNDLNEGDRVESVFTGAVLESYPVQAVAKVVRVIND